MRQAKVVLGGLHYYEKLDILKRLQQLHRAPQIQNEGDQWHSIASIEIKYHNNYIRISSFNGAVLHYKLHYPKLLRGADMVIYMSSGMLPKHEPQWPDYHSNQLSQQDNFLTYREYAMATNTHWMNIPWIWLITTNIRDAKKGERQNTSIDNPLSSTFPANALRNFIHCNTLTGEGIDRIWNTIISTLQKRGAID